jgi:hypothetical protein
VAATMATAAETGCRFRLATVVEKFVALGKWGPIIKQWFLSTSSYGLRKSLFVVLY